MFLKLKGKIVDVISRYSCTKSFYRNYVIFKRNLLLIFQILIYKRPYYL